MGGLVFDGYRKTSSLFDTYNFDSIYTAKEVRDLYGLAAPQDNLSSYFCNKIADIFIRGRGKFIHAETVSIDNPEEAKRWMQLSLRRDTSPKNLIDMARLYDQISEFYEAIPLYDQAAKYGTWTDKMRVANIFYEDRRFEKAQHWYEQAGETTNYPEEMMQIGAMFESGKRISKNLDRAIVFYVRAMRWKNQDPNGSWKEWHALDAAREAAKIILDNPTERRPSSDLLSQLASFLDPENDEQKEDQPKRAFFNPDRAGDVVKAKQLRIIKQEIDGDNEKRLAALEKAAEKVANQENKAAE